MKGAHAVWVVVVVMVLTVILTTVSYFVLSPSRATEKYNVEMIPMDLTVGDVIGMNIDTDGVHFGTLKPGSSAAKTITVATADWSLVEFSVVGNIKSLIHLSETRIELEGENETNISVSAHVGEDELFGERKGELIVSLKR